MAVRNAAGPRSFIGRAGTVTELSVPGDGDWRTRATIGLWLCECPGQSPAWSQYALSAVHLRNVEGQDRAPVLTTPDATHEIVVAALDPAARPTPTDWEGRIRPLRPLNVVHQVESLTDEQCDELLELCARAIAHGWLPAEPPFSPNPGMWIRSIDQTAEHLRLGVHPRV